jgi:2-keto-4-pentenoate hydratase/2-oxohepta-3-ene-1,7-dioic acid hydratase in catechol pathway
MKLATARLDGDVCVAVISGQTAYPVHDAGAGRVRDMIAFLAAGQAGLAAARRSAAGAGGVPLAQVELLAPVPRPGKFLAIGLNYADHVKETGRDLPEHPAVFCKQGTAVNAPNGAIVLPPESSQVDYEGELAVVVGRRCRRVPREHAFEVVAGFTIVNDVSVRDWQRRSPTFTVGKGWDSHAPMGPWIVTLDEIAEGSDPNALELRTWVNDGLRQHSNTRQLMRGVPELIEMLSTCCTLEPGDVIATGTPEGVGMAMKPPGFLTAGDLVRIEIEGIGTLENPVVAEFPVSRYW